VKKATLVLDKISKSFHGETEICLFKNISYTFMQSQSYAIVGVSGTGKSTLIQILAGLEQPSLGKVIYNGQSITSLSPLEYQRFLHNDIGLVFQFPYLIRELSVIENVMIKGLIAHRPYVECQDEAQHLLERVGLFHKASMMPATLSGGEQQRVALARALMLKPAFLLADEPTAHLDEATRMVIVDLIKNCGQEWDMGIILSTHDRAVASCMNSLLEIHEGQLIDRTAVSTS
jgi:ABC-type lipoprotein export system ATPase subunit